MNQATEDVIEFLNFPESDFGTTLLDAEIVQDPALLRDRVAALLDVSLSSPDSRTMREGLRGRLDEADWGEVSREMSERVNMASGFFDPVEANIKEATR